MEASSEKICVLCKEPSKYCCPGCSRRTCSLKCVKLHKEQFQCSGNRDRTKFIDVQQFKNTELLSDYRFLEDVSRSVENAGRNIRKFGYTGDYLPQKLYRLKVAAKYRKTNLCLLPSIFMKRKKNSTFLHFKSRTIFWHVEWSFVDADITYTDERLDEGNIINFCLDKYLLPDKSSPEIQQKLSFYQSYGHKGVAVLLQKEDDPSKRYYELNRNKSFKENFHGKKIVEYPVLIVVPCHSLSVYDIVTQDDEMPDVIICKQEPEEWKNFNFEDY